MGSDDLVALAKRFVDLTAELDATRDAMRWLLMNGAGGEAAPRPTQARPKPGARHPNAIKAAEIEASIVALLRTTPGMRTAAVAKATGARTSTTVERLKRMKDKGLAQGGGDAGWSAAVV